MFGRQAGILLDRGSGPQLIIESHFSWFMILRAFGSWSHLLLSQRPQRMWSVEFGMQSTDQRLIDILKAAVYDVNLKELGDINAGTKISELGLDSVAMMEVIGVLEENLSIQIKDEQISALAYVGIF